MSQSDPAAALEVSPAQRVQWAKEIALATGWELRHYETALNLARDHATLLARVAALEQERDEAKEAAKRAWAANTDERVVGFHRDMAARLAESRDELKHKCRKQAETQQALAAALELGEHELSYALKHVGESHRIRLVAAKDRLKAVLASVQAGAGEPVDDAGRSVSR